MTDIKPDTSLYTDLPSRLRAMALIWEGPRERLQHSPKGLAWRPWRECTSSPNDKQRVADLVGGVFDYRLKPAPPARLYVDITDEGKVAHAYDGPMVPMPGATRVTYILENPDANG